MPMGTVAFAGPEEDGVVVERIRMNSFYTQFERYPQVALIENLSALQV
jgi:hypothetical protein